MRSNSKALLVATIGLCLTGVALAAEKRISKSDLPPAVQKTAQEQSQGSIVRGYTTDTENGKVEYEVQMTTHGHSKDVTIAPDGQLMEVEQQVTIDTLPADVKAGLLGKAGKGRIAKIESLTRHGSIVAYEAQVIAAGKHSEVQVGPDGQPLDHEE
jgi:uncharacterized membrane protein YkoI